MVTSGKARQRLMDMRLVRCQTAGSLPLPMWVCTRTTFSWCFATSACTCGTSSCQMPKLARRQGEQGRE